MNKKVLWAILGVVLVVAIIVGVIFMTKSDNYSEEELVKIETLEELQKAIEEVHNNVTVELPGLDTMQIDVEDEYLFTRYTGLSSNEDVETLIVTMPLINAQAYEAAIIKVKDGADVEEMKEEILNNIDMSMWVCVSAEKLYVTNYKNMIFLVMGSSEWADPVLASFKSYVGENNIGKVLDKEQDFEDIELPPEILLDPVVDSDFEVEEPIIEDAEITSGEQENMELPIVE